MATVSENYIDLMIDSLKKKIEVLTEIKKLNGLQAEILAKEDFDIDEFDANVHEKAEQIDKLDLLDDGFNSLFIRVKQVIDENKSAYSVQIKEIQGLIIKITDLSVEVEAGEKRNKLAADKQFSKLKKDVKEAKRSTNMASQYYKSMSKYENTPQFLDKKN